MTTRKVFVLLAMFAWSVTLVAQTGKISGRVTDAQSRDPLIGVNVVVEGTAIGASTDAGGFYTILNVPPGMHTVRASMVGYAPAAVVDVRVAINQTSQVDIELSETVIQAQEIVVTARRPIIEKDVSGSRANISSREILSLPISQLSSVIGLQAGVSGLSVRGGGLNQTAFIVDGLNFRDERDYTPYAAIGLLAVQEIQVQTGGFNAEYGHARSGVINVVTKEGSLQHYNIGAIVRVKPPTKKYFGMPPNHPMSYWIRPFLDDAVAWTGTRNGAWDPWTQAQYAPFEGWNSISRKLVADDDPLNDLTPQAAQRLFLWQHRKNFDITKPDYDIDVGVGGPVPIVGAQLGNLRFYGSFRYTNTQYAIPLSRDAVTDYSGLLKLTSDLGVGMKLMVEGLLGRNEAVDANQSGVYGSFGGAASIGNAMNRVSFIDTRLFSTDYWAPNAVNRNMIGAKYTHVLSPRSFYEVSVQRFHSSYATNPGRLRDTSRVYKFGNSYYVDEAPFGFFPNPGNYSATSIQGMRMAIGMSNARDSSKLTRYQIRADLNVQIDNYNEIKAGLEFAYIDNQVNYGSVDLVLPSGRSTSKWRTFPTRLSLYVQDKLEYSGMIANIGLRFDMSHAGGEWYVYDPYTRDFKGVRSFGIDTLLERQPTKRVTALSPRLGVSFPITEDAKLFFNYGHFRDIPTPENLFLVRRETASNDIIRIADPNLPLQRTVSYELGYEHNLFDMHLFRLSAYYKDISNQSRLVSYIGYNNVPNYTVTTSTSYEDIRGFEVTLSKNRGDWIQGFVNYEYRVSTSGNFGRPRYYQNPVDQRTDERVNPVVTRPVPRPIAKANIDLFTPYEFGPQVGEFSLLGDIRMSMIANWTSGFYFTWVGGGSVPGVVNNIQWRDTYGLDVRIAKNINFGRLNIQLFADINNVLNLKQLSTYGFVDGTDYENYLKSLHLPEEFGRWYPNIPGNDRPGDYRKAGVEYQPMIYAASLSVITNPHARPFYYDASSRRYYRWVNNAWQPVDQATVDKVLDDKAYIDMPNQDWFNFLNPRNVFFGVRFSFDI